MAAKLQLRMGFMSALAIPEFPHPRSSDGDEVRTALEVAAACWERDEVEDTVRWLRRASQAAAQSDHLERAMELSKWVADAARNDDAEEETSPGPRSGVVPTGVRVHLPPPPALPNLEPEPTLAPPRAHEEVLVEDDDDDVPTLIRRVPVPLSHEGPEVIDIDAGLVAVRRIGDRVEVTPLAPGGLAPPGAAVVMMVAPSAYDADLLARWLR